MYTQLFTRWVNQKISKRMLPPIQDVVTDLAHDDVLVQLMEILSERECPFRRVTVKFKAQRIENLSKALQFVWDCGVTATLKASAENLDEGNENQVRLATNRQVMHVCIA